MLVLTRKEGEGIMIGSDVVVRIIEIKGGNVKVGIEAPKTTPVHRHEVYERISRENLSAAANTPDSLKGVMRLYRRVDPHGGPSRRGGKA